MDLSWSGASDGSGSGVHGYSYAWDHSASSTPDATEDTTGASLTSSPLADASDWYFHIRTRDNSGLWNAGAAHFGPIKIDTTNPTAPTSASETGGAANNVWQKLVGDPNFSWSGATDAGSGVVGYYYYWGSEPAGVGASYTVSAAYNPTAVSGTQVLYLRAQSKDLLNHTSSWANLFTFKYDPDAPSSAVSGITALVPGKSYQVSWSGSDSGSGLASYDIQYKQGAGGAWTDWLSATTAASANFGPSSPVTPIVGETYYFRSRARDALGNLEAYPSSADMSITVTETVNMYLPLVVR